MACSSKLVEPMMMVGFEAAEATAEVPRVTSMVSATAPIRRRVKRMSGSFSSRNGVVLPVPVLQLGQTLFRHTTVTTDVILSSSLRIVKVAGQRGRSGPRRPLDGGGRGQHVPGSAVMAQPGRGDRSLEQTKSDGEESGQQDDQERGAERLDAVVAAEAGQQGRPQV